MDGLVSSDDDRSMHTRGYEPQREGLIGQDHSLLGPPFMLSRTPPPLPQWR